MNRYAALERLSTVKESKENQALALQRQHDDNEALAQALGGVVGEHYCDPDKSAYKEGVVRPEFDRCLQALDTWDGLIASDLDRVTRDPAIGEVIIARVRQCSNPVIYTRNPEAESGIESFDLSTERGREHFRLTVISIRREARKASERQARRHAQWRDAGRPVGARAFGEKKGKLELDDREAGIIRDGAMALLAGKPLWHLVEEWRLAGVVGPRGKALDRVSVRNMYLCPRMAGWRVHRPETKKGEPAIPRQEWIARHSLTGEPIRSQVPAILTQGVWEAVCAELQGRKDSVATTRPYNRAKYVLSGCVYCESCAQQMWGQWVKKKNRHSYRCPTGCGMIHGPELERYVSSVLLEHWASAPELVPDIQPFHGEAEIERLSGKLLELRQAYKADRLSLDEYLEEKGSVNQELEPLKVDQKKWTKAQVTPKALGSAELWEQADTDGKRLMVRQELLMVKVGRAQRGLKQFDAGRVSLVWR